MTEKRGGRREGAGRKPAPGHLKKVPYNTKLPQWLKDWLTDPAREESGPVLIEVALREAYHLEPPEGSAYHPLHAPSHNHTSPGAARPDQHHGAQSSQAFQRAPRTPQE